MNARARRTCWALTGMVSALAVAACGDPLTLPTYFGDPLFELELFADGLEEVPANEEVHLTVAGLDTTSRRVGLWSLGPVRPVGTSTATISYKPSPGFGGIEPEVSVLRLWYQTWPSTSHGPNDPASRGPSLLGLAPHHLLLYVPDARARRALAERDPRGISGAEDLVVGYNLLEVTCRPDAPADGLAVIPNETIVIAHPSTSTSCLRFELPVPADADLDAGFMPALGGIATDG